MKAGRYYVGDPCYVIQGKDYFDWDLFCEILFSETQYEMAGYCTLKFKNHEVFVAGTFMDGEFSDTESFSYPVDSGNIGCVPMELVTISEEEMKKFGRIVEFAEDFNAYSDEKNIFIGNIRIYIDKEEDKEDEYDDDLED